MGARNIDSRLARIGSPSYPHQLRRMKFRFAFAQRNPRPRKHLRPLPHPQHDSDAEVEEMEKAAKLAEETRIANEKRLRLMEAKAKLASEQAKIQRQQDSAAKLNTLIAK